MFANCSSQTRNHKQKDDKLDVCTIASNLKDYKDSLIQNPKIILNGNDSCVIHLLDQIKFNIYNSQNSLEYYDLLEAISRISDGYISDYLIDISLDLFDNNYRNFSTFLFNHKESKLSFFLVESWSLRVSEADDESEELNLIRQIIIDDSSDSDIKNYLLKLHGKINPNIWD